MTKDCSLIYHFSTWKLQAQNMEERTCCVHKLFWMSKQNQKTICVHNMFFPCFELAVLMYWADKTMHNLLSYCGLIDVRINASDKDLPVILSNLWIKICRIRKCQITQNIKTFPLNTGPAKLTSVSVIPFIWFFWALISRKSDHAWTIIFTCYQGLYSIHFLVFVLQNQASFCNIYMYLRFAQGSRD